MFLRTIRNIIDFKKLTRHPCRGSLFLFLQFCFSFRYDVRFQEGMECGGAYIKLISEGGIQHLTEFHDKSPYTIMFGPDKCGNDHKLHFIFRYKSPKVHNYSFRWPRFEGRFYEKVKPIIAVMISKLQTKTGLYNLENVYWCFTRGTLLLDLTGDSLFSKKQSIKNDFL